MVPVVADTAHLVGGRCEAVEAAARGRGRALSWLKRMREATYLGTTEKGKGARGRVVRPGLEQVVEVLDGARAALAGKATAVEREERQWACWRSVLAGALPRPGDEVAEAERQRAAKVMVEGVVELQREVAGWVEEWEEVPKALEPQIFLKGAFGGPSASGAFGPVSH